MAEPTPRTGPATIRSLAVYGAFLVGAVALFQLACHFGNQLPRAAAWCLLALVLGIARESVTDAAIGCGLTVGYILFMFLVARPVLARLVPRIERNGIGQGTIALVFLALLLSALATDWIGVHAVFGAFLLGAVIPHDSAIARDLSHKLEDLVATLLLPAFFAYTGMRTQVGLVSGWGPWLACGLIILAATLGKFGGTFVAGRATGLGWRDSAALGALMNTRGLMELIVLNIGLEQGVISPTLFAMLVLMALATTMITTPALRLLGVRGEYVAGTTSPVPDK